MKEKQSEKHEKKEFLIKQKNKDRKKHRDTHTRTQKTLTREDTRLFQLEKDIILLLCCGGTQISHQHSNQHHYFPTVMYCNINNRISKVFHQFLVNCKPKGKLKGNYNRNELLS